MSINFVCPQEGSYRNIVSSLVDPILEHLPEGRKIEQPEPGLNVGFFLAKSLSGGCQVFMSHGIADKNWRPAVNVKRFDHVFVSGPAWRDLYIRQGLNPGKIRIGGYTKLDPIFQGKIKKGENIRVLWAPTHGGFDNGRIPATSSYPHFAKYLNEIDGADFALHPSANKKNGSRPTIQKLFDAEVIIADCGSLIYEALALGKPVIIPDWIVREGIMKYFPKSFECLMFEQDICYHARDINHLKELIPIAIEQGIDEKTKNFIDSIFPPEFRGKSGEATANILREIRGS